MLILAIDTSAVASAALVSDDALEGEVASFATEDTRSHAEVLAPGIEDLLSPPASPARTSTRSSSGVGPGPFTGLRSGIATARTLAFVWDKPLHGADEPGRRRPGSGRVHRCRVHEFLVATDARRKEVYWARYSLAERPAAAAGGRPARRLRRGPAGPAGLRGRRRTLHRRRCALIPASASEQPDAAVSGPVRPGPARCRRLQLLDSTPLYLRESDAQVPGPRKRAL